jgi:hypothetical protein
VAFPVAFPVMFPVMFIVSAFLCCPVHRPR